MITPDPAGFSHVLLPDRHDVVAPDGSLVRILARVPAGSMAQFELAAGHVSAPVVHRTVSELWSVTGGLGSIWRDDGRHREELELAAGVSLTIPVGTAFQFRSRGPGPLLIVGVTMPPWPGDGEAVPAPGPWSPGAGRAEE